MNTFTIVCWSLLGLGITYRVFGPKPVQPALAVERPRMALRDADVLCYCSGCGCRHRTRNMDWTPDGVFRCGPCCGLTGGN